jgi:hypothetical protein
MAKRSRNLTFQKRVQERVKALGESPITLAQRVGLRREFIRDIVEGRKFSVGADALTLVAQALECDVTYLTGDSDQPRPLEAGDTGLTPAPSDDLKIVAGPGTGRQMTFCGLCWSGIWQNLDAPPRFRPVKLPADPRFPDTSQVVYRLEGMAMSDAGRDAFVIGMAPDQFTKRVGPIVPGVFVVAKRVSKDRGGVELSVRLVEQSDGGVRLADVAGTQPPLVMDRPPKNETVSIEAVVLFGIQLMV